MNDSELRDVAEANIKNSKVLCEKFYECPVKKRLLPGQMEEYCYSAVKSLDCPYEHGIKPRRRF